MKWILYEAGGSHHHGRQGRLCFHYLRDSPRAGFEFGFGFGFRGALTRSRNFTNNGVQFACGAGCKRTFRRDLISIYQMHEMKCVQSKGDTYLHTPETKATTLKLARRSSPAPLGREHSEQGGGGHPPMRTAGIFHATLKLRLIKFDYYAPEVG